MSRHLLIALCAILVHGALAPDSAKAAGEVFRIKVKATEFCGNFDFVKLNTKNSIPLWLRVDSDTQHTVSLTQGFEAENSFQLGAVTYLMTPKKASMLASVGFQDGSFLTVQGIAKIKHGRITSIKGIFIQDGAFFLGCFSAGKFKTTKP